MTNKPEHTELKPCPLCGGVCFIAENESWKPEALLHEVNCTKCIYTTRPNHKEETIKSHNTRANTVNDELVKALDAVCNSVDEHGDICVTYDTLYKCCAALAKARGEA